MQGRKIGMRRQVEHGINELEGKLSKIRRYRKSDEASGRAYWLWDLEIERLEALIKNLKSDRLCNKCGRFKVVNHETPLCLSCFGKSVMGG